MKLFFIFLLLGGALTSIDPYQILGLPPYASKAQIKEAFRNITLKMHPDRNPHAHNFYKDVVAAYQTLKANNYIPKLQKSFEVLKASRSFRDIEWELNNIGLDEEKQDYSFLYFCRKNPSIVLASALISAGLFALFK